MKPAEGILAIVAVLIFALIIFFATQFSVENAPSVKGTAILCAAALFLIMAIIRGMHEEPQEIKPKQRRK